MQRWMDGLCVGNIIYSFISFYCSTQQIAGVCTIRRESLVLAPYHLLTRTNQLVGMFVTVGSMQSFLKYP